MALAPLDDSDFLQPASQASENGNGRKNAGHRLCQTPEILSRKHERQLWNLQVLSETILKVRLYSGGRCTSPTTLKRLADAVQASGSVLFAQTTRKRKKEPLDHDAGVARDRIAGKKVVVISDAN